jgi:hypothetical protein
VHCSVISFTHQANTSALDAGKLISILNGNVAGDNMEILTVGHNI